MRVHWLAVPLLGLAACNAPESAETNTTAPEPAASEAVAAAPEATGGVTRQEVADENAAPAPLQAIQTQPGPGGSQVDLVKVAVTGDIMTVTFRCSSDEKYNTKGFRVSEISVIDDATAQRISVLKDNAGNWMTSNSRGDYVNVGCEIKPGVLWAKFPAPPATSKTVSITLPEAGAFDGVPVTR